MNSKLLNAIIHNDDYEVWRLLQAGADANSEYEVSRPIFSMRSIANRFINKKPNHGQKALIMALEAQGIRDSYPYPLVYLPENPEMISYLLEKGANPNVISNSGETPLMLAIFADKDSTAKILISYNADINARDNSGNTALIYAVKYGSDSLIKYLIEHYARVSSVNNIGESALSIAPRVKLNSDIVNIMKNAVTHEH